MSEYSLQDPNQGVFGSNEPAFDPSIFEVVDGKVNLTKICQHFGKRLDVWLKTKSTKDFLKSYSKVTPNGGIQVILGKDKEQGTFGTRQVALKLAQWISPEFEVFCIQKLDELFQTGKTELNKPALPASLTIDQILQLNQNAIVKLKEKNKELALENKQLEQKTEEDKPKVDYYDQVTASVNAVSVQEFWKKAKIKETFGYNYRDFWAWLRDNDYIFLKYSNGTRLNLPYQKWTDKGIFTVDEYIRTDKHGNSIAQATTKVTGKGKTYLLKKLQKEWESEFEEEEA